MAYTLKVLEKVAGTDTVDAITGAYNLFKSISTGYSATSAAISFDGIKIWNCTGNAAATGMAWGYNTGIAYALNKQVYFRARVTVGAAGLSSIYLRVTGSTSGVVNITGTGTVTSPTQWATYDLYGVATLTGLVGNIVLQVVTTDATTTNGKSVYIENWVGVDLTVRQGAGFESTAANMEAFVLWRSNNWTFQDWYEGPLAGTDGGDQYFIWLRVQAHGLSDYDVIMTTTGTGVREAMQVKVIDANWLAVGWYVYYSTFTFDRWSRVDRTSYVQSKSMSIDLRSDLSGSASFRMKATATWQPQIGMTVQIWDGSTLIHAGKIDSISKIRIPANSEWFCDCVVGSFSMFASRSIYSYNAASSGLGTTVRKSLYNLWFNFGYKWGVVMGRNDASTNAIGDVRWENRTTSDLLNTIARQDGKFWYIDKERRLNFQSVDAVPAAAAHALVDGNGYTRYTDLTYEESSDQFATNIVATGGYATDASVVSAEGKLSDLGASSPVTEDTEACVNEWWMLLSDSAFNNATNAALAAREYLKIYGLQIPAALSFDSDDVDWRPNTKLQVQLSALGIASSKYFNIDSVVLYDFDGKGTMRASVKASQRDGTTFASAPNVGGNSYVGDMQSKAQASVAAVVQESGVFTPAFKGSGTAGTWGYFSRGGQYIRLGNMIFFWLRIAPNSIAGSPTGNAVVYQLPYPIAAGQAPVFTMTAKDLNWGTSMTKINAYGTPSTSELIFYGQLNNGTWAIVPVANVGTSDDIFISGAYQCAT